MDRNKKSRYPDIYYKCNGCVMDGGYYCAAPDEVNRECLRRALEEELKNMSDQELAEYIKNG